jgi:hypothetical protein
MMRQIETCDITDLIEYRFNHHLHSLPVHLLLPMEGKPQEVGGSIFTAHRNRYLWGKLQREKNPLINYLFTPSLVISLSRVYGCLTSSLPSLWHPWQPKPAPRGRSGPKSINHMILCVSEFVHNWMNNSSFSYCQSDINRSYDFEGNIDVTASIKKYFCQFTWSLLFIVFTADRHLGFLAPHMRIASSAFCPPVTSRMRMCGAKTPRWRSAMKTMNMNVYDSSNFLLEHPRCKFWF